METTNKTDFIDVYILKTLNEIKNSVEKSKNKTKFTSKLFEEVRRNKRFYINRPNENSQKLFLTLQPRKTK